MLGLAWPLARPGGHGHDPRWSVTVHVSDLGSGLAGRADGERDARQPVPGSRPSTGFRAVWSRGADHSGGDLPERQQQVHGELCRAERLPALLRLRAREYANLPLASNDVGTGFFDAGPPRLVGGFNTASGRVGDIDEGGGSPWDRYEEDGWHRAEQPGQPQYAAIRDCPLLPSGQRAAHGHVQHGLPATWITTCGGPCPGEPRHLGLAELLGGWSSTQPPPVG